jgi:hypothetical protein
MVGKDVLILQLIEEFKLWLKEIKGGSEEVKENRWKEIFSDLKNFANYGNIEEIKKFIKAGTGNRNNGGWWEPERFFDTSETKYLLEFIEIKEKGKDPFENLKKNSQRGKLWVWALLIIGIFGLIIKIITKVKSRKTGKSVSFKKEDNNRNLD